MPGISLEETFKRLREINPGVRVVIMSAFSQEELPGSYEQMKYLAKPVTLKAIEETVRAAGIRLP